MKNWKPFFILSNNQHDHNFIPKKAMNREVLFPVSISKLLYKKNAGAFLILEIFHKKKPVNTNWLF
jgi:hypothetical protein